MSGITSPLSSYKKTLDMDIPRIAASQTRADWTSTHSGIPDIMESAIRIKPIASLSVSDKSALFFLPSLSIGIHNRLRASDRLSTT